MKKFLLFLALFFAHPVLAQLPANGNLTVQGTAAGCTVSSTACLYVNLPAGAGASGIELSGTWTGTVSFYTAVTASGVTKALSSTDATPVSSATGNGAWQFNTAAFRIVLVVFTTASSGTVKVNVTTSTASARATGGGGGGGGITALTQDVSASGTGSVAATVVGLNNTLLSGLATGILKNATGTGVPSIALAGTDYVAPTGSAAGLTGYPWSALANGSGNLSISPGGSTTLNTTSAVADYFSLPNITAATSGTSQSSPVFSFCGTEWHAAGSVRGCIGLQIQPGNGTDAASTFSIVHEGSATGTVTTTFPGPIQAGASASAGAITIPQGTANGHAGTTQITVEAPAAVTSYELVLPGVSASGLVRRANASAVDTESISELSGDATTSGSNAVTVVKVNGNTYPGSTAFTSGGVGCATSTSVFTTSVLLTTNVYLKGGGAGACPGLGLTTDDGTSSTYTGTGGTKSPVFTSTGTTAGFVDYPQGSTSAAVAPCNVANTICEQAPAAVTSFLYTKAGVAPDIASYKQTDGCAAASCTESFHPVPVLMTVASDFTDSTSTSLQLITGLSTTLPVSKAVVVSFHCGILFDQGTAAVSDQLGIGITGTAPSQANAGASVFISTSATTSGTLVALASTTPTSVVTFTPSAITTIWRAELDGTVEQPSNATPGVLGIYVATTTGTDNIIVKRGSFCTVAYQ